MDWASEIDLIKEMTNNQFENYRKIRFGSVGEVVKVLLLVGCALMFCYYTQAQSIEKIDNLTIQDYCKTLCEDAMSSKKCRSTVIYVADIINKKPIAYMALSKTEDGRITNMPISEIDIPGTAAGKSLHLLAILTSGYNPKELYVDTDNGIYNCNDDLIEDEPYAAKGGLGRLSCYDAYLKNSRVGMMMSLDHCYGGNIAKYRNAIRHTKIRLIGDSDYPDEDENDPFGVYDAIDILGIRTHLGFMEYVDFIYNLLLPIDIDSELEYHYATLRQAMADHVRLGVGHLAYDSHFELAGMTDVSYPDVNLNRTATFGGFYPVDSPKYIIAVVINKHGNSGISDVCVLARTIAEKISLKESTEVVSEIKRYHPAEKGR